MESPVVIDKPPEYHGNGNDGRGFPFDEEEGSGAWSELAARHPDIAARLRQRPSTWASKRRPTSQDGDDFGDSFRGFDRFPFDEIPPEFRGHFPSHWNRRFGSRDEAPPPPPPAPAPQQAAAPPQSPQQSTAATQTELAPETIELDPQTTLPQYGLRNTVDLGQKSPADPSLIDAQERGQRSMSAPPDNRSPTPNQSTANRKMSSQNHKEGQEHPSNVRHIPIFVEGRDEPVINKTVDHGAHYADAKPAYPSPPQQPHIDREQYFAEEGPTNFHHNPGFSRAFGTPFNKAFGQNSQPFVQQKVYPQNAFARGASPQRSQSPKQQMHPEEHYAKVPVHHEHVAPPSRPQQKQQKPVPQQQHQTPPQQHQQQPSPGQHQHPAPPQHPPPRQETPPPKPQVSASDPITQILSIQTDVLNLMTDVENFVGNKKDKRYMFLDEMLTRNLIKLDNIETDGKENIRQARKEAIRCIQKCIAVLEAKAEKGNSTPQPQDIDMAESTESQTEQTEAKENGEVDMKEADNKENGEIDTKNVCEGEKTGESLEPTVVQEKEKAELQTADTRPEEAPSEVNIDNKAKTEKSEQNTDTEKKSSSKKIVKKRDKSKDKKNLNEPSNKEEQTMQVDAKGEKEQMDVDASASQ